MHQINLSIRYIYLTENTGFGGLEFDGLYHICPTFLGICYFIWLAFILAVIAIVIFVILRCRKKEEEKEGQR